MKRTILKPSPPIVDTGCPMSSERLQSDASNVLEYLWSGENAIVALDVAYAVVGHKEAAIRRIFKAKNRSYEKPSGMFANWQMSQAIHQLPAKRHDMIREMIEQVNLPFSVVAPFDVQHPFFSRVDPFVLAHSSKQGTIDMLLNAGSLHNELADQSWQAGLPVFGSSANTSLKGSKYRLEDIEPEVLEIASICVDHGRSLYANESGLSSTIIDFSTFRVLRVGVNFDQLQRAFLERFDVSLKV